MKKVNVLKWRHYHEVRLQKGRMCKYFNPMYSFINFENLELQKRTLMNISANYKYAIVIKKCMLVFLLSICEIIYYL